MQSARLSLQSVVPQYKHMHCHQHIFTTSSTSSANLTHAWSPLVFCSNNNWHIIVPRYRVEWRRFQRKSSCIAQWMQKRSVMCARTSQNKGCITTNQTNFSSREGIARRAHVPLPHMPHSVISAPPLRNLPTLLSFSTSLPIRCAPRFALSQEH